MKPIHAFSMAQKRRIRIGAPFQSAFTLIELLVLAGLLAVLAATLLPALSRTAPNSQAMQCMNNLRQMTAGWTMYSDDNNGRLVYNTDGPNTGKTTGPNGMYGAGWVAGWLTVDVITINNADNTNVFNLVVHSPNIGQTYGWSGFLGPYLRDPGVFKCPADKTLVTMGLRRVPRVRSISMNNCVGWGARLWTAPHWAPGATQLSQESGSQFSVFFKLPQMGSPASLFVFLDEHPDGINDGDFFTDPDQPFQLVDYPAAYHNRAGGLSFADGHTEVHKWLDPRTMPWPGGAQTLALNVNLPNDLDVSWLQQHASQRR